MFSAIRRAFGAIKVVETSNEIQVGGVPADVLQRDISKLWSTNRINQNMFTYLGKNEFRFPKFFAIEVHYMLQQIDEYRNARSTSRTVRSIIAEMEANTWLKQVGDYLENEQPKSRVDTGQLSKLNIKLFDHQNSFINAYGRLTEMFGLKGYLLAADPGTGKTAMGLALAECLHSDLTIIISPKNALYRVWTSTIDWIYKTPRKYWVASEGKPYHGEKIIVTHYEALQKAIEVVKRTHGSRPVIILDESHNLNEAKSNRTQLFLEIGKVTKSQNILWSSGTPLKAMGYEMVPLLRSIDPLFTDDVERRFLKIFGKASDRALDILRNRIGKVSYHVSGNEVINVTKRSESMKIEIPNADEYTLDSIREKMRRFIDQRMTYYKSQFKTFQRQYDEGLKAFEQTMKPEQKEGFKRYQKAIRLISGGYDPVDHKDDAIFANQFEEKAIIPAIKDKVMRDNFKNARSVIKYLKLKVVGEALGGVVGKARAQCHVDMVKAINWKAIADKSAKKVIVFSSYVDVIKAADEKIRKAGFKTEMVYGDTNANVAGIVKKFGDDESVKFLLATYQSLSTAVPLTMADVTVFVNAPFRSFEKDQAEARTARIGQDSPVLFINTYLDTGKEPNISTRSKDILEWSRDQVQAMLGGLSVDGAAAELNKDYNEGAMESYAEYGTNFVPTFNALMGEVQ